MLKTDLRRDPIPGAEKLWGFFCLSSIFRNSFGLRKKFVRNESEKRDRRSKAKGL